MKKQDVILLDLCIDDNQYGFAASALSKAETELHELEEQINETLETINKLTPNCDKLDYILAASSGALCGLIDIFLVGKPGESPLGNITDKWFENRIKDFAKLCGWKGTDSTSSAVRFLENQFKIPYDQRGAGDAASEVFGLSPKNHHFKSLAHNPTLLGLFFSILDQFTNSSHFISNGQLISLDNADGSFKLHGNDIPSKLFCAFANWIGHLISDMSGASGSKSRGMGIPSPFLAWSNDVIAIKIKLHIPVNSFDKAMNEMALKMYEQGFDFRFQTAQAIPVFINEIVVRLIYSIRRLIKYFAETEPKKYSFSSMWKACEPFSNATVKKMLTVAYGTFCLVDIGDTTVRSFITGAFNPVEFCLRLNIIGIGRFGISLYGEIKRGIRLNETKIELHFLERKKTIVLDYIEGLKILDDVYNDRHLLTFIDDFQNSGLYTEAFQKSVILAEKRNVPSNKILKSKADIDKYFKGGKK